MDLLVHIAAASSKRDDDRYKRQARAYGGFEVSRTTPIERTAVASHHGAEIPTVPLNIAGSQEITVSTWSPSSFLEDTQLARTALESQLITSSLRQEQCHLDLNSCAPPEEIISSPADPPSYSVPNPRAPLREPRCSSPTKSQESYEYVPSAGLVSLGEDEGPALNYPQSSKSPASAPVRREMGGSVQRSSWSTSGDDIPSQLPSTYSLSDMASAVSHQQEGSHLSSPNAHVPSTPSRTVRKGISRTSTVHGNPSTPSKKKITATIPITSHRRHSARKRSSSPLSPLHDIRRSSGHTTASLFHGNGSEVISSSGTSRSAASSQLPDTAQPPRKSGEYQDARRLISARRSSDVDSKPQASFQRTISAIAMPPPPRPVESSIVPASTAQAKPEDLTVLRTLSRSICPGPPPTSSEPFTSHVTPALNILYRNPNLSHCYHPKRTTRLLRQSERGYWLLDPSGWSVGLQIALWRFLEKHVGSGDAGWGVWCTREADESEESAEPEATPGPVKIFCWGEIVQHMYMMLYVASKSQLKRANSAWIDADGEVVVQM